MTARPAESMVGRPFNTDGLGFILSAIILGTIGVLSFIVQPGLVQGFVSEFGYSEAAANDLAFWEMAGVALATVVSALAIKNMNIKLVVGGAILVAAVGNVFSAYLGNDFESQSAVRFAIGLGEGAIISISFSMIGLTTKVQRNLAWYLVLLLVYGAFGLWIMPTAFDTVGLPGIFAIWAGLSIVALGTIPFLPRSMLVQDETNAGAVQLPNLMLVAALTAVLFYNAGIGLAWANLFLIGLSLGAGEQEVANALLLSQFVAIGGAFVAVFMAEVIRPRYVIAVGTLLGAVSIATLLPEPSFIVFTVAVCVFNFLWNMTLPFILSAVSNMDRTGRMIAAAIAMQMIGLGFGPFIAARLLGEGGDFASVEWLTVILLVLSFLVIIGPVVLRYRMFINQEGSAA